MGFILKTKDSCGPRRSGAARGFSKKKHNNDM